jgi:hypothetical protein
MIVGISQPTVFPWLGYFHMIKNSDVFVLLDNVKFEKHSWHMRNRIRQKSNEKEPTAWIKIPTIIKKSETKIKDVLIDNSQKWRESHIKAFQINYGKNYEKMDFLQSIYEREWMNLCEFNVKSIIECCNYLKISTKIIRASELSVSGKKSHLVLDICKKVNADEYIAALGSKAYLENDLDIFKNEKINVKFNEYTHPTYNQDGNSFISNLSILDLIFNEQEKSCKYI